MKPPTDNFRESQQHGELDVLLPHATTQLIQVNWCSALCTVLVDQKRQDSVRTLAHHKMPESYAYAYHVTVAGSHFEPSHGQCEQDQHATHIGAMYLRASAPEHRYHLSGLHGAQSRNTQDT